MMILANAIKERFPARLTYADACQLCCWLHILKNNFPSELNGYSGEKNELANTFSHLCRSGHFDLGSASISAASLSQPDHWLRLIIDSVYRNEGELDENFPRKFPDIFPGNERTPPRPGEP